MAMRADSWRYPLEHLDGKRPAVIALASFLERHKPRFTKPKAKALAERLKRGHPLGPTDVERLAASGAPFPLLDEFIATLNAVHEAYRPDRVRREKFRRELEALRSQIPADERQVLQAMYRNADCSWFLSDEDRVQAGLKTFKACRTWIAMTDGERIAWFERARKHSAAKRAESDEHMRKWRAKFEAEFGAKYGHNFSDILAGRTSSPSDLRALGLGPSATSTEIKSAFRRLAKQHHPDAGGDPQQFIKIQAAYSRLTGAAS